MIDWSNPDCQVTDHFKVKECLWLPQWNRLANESDGLNDEIKTNLVRLCTKLEIVRLYVNKPFNVHCTYRPLDYNKLIGGATHSAHMDGMAMDFDATGLSCDDAKQLIMPCLEQWGLRLEDNGSGAGWIHLDYKLVLNGGNRFFKP